MWDVIILCNKQNKQDMVGDQSTLLSGYMLIPRKLYTALSNATAVYFVSPIAVGLRRS